MALSENTIKMIQMDAFETQEQIMEKKISENLKNKFDPRVRLLFHELADLKEAYEKIMIECQLLIEEVVVGQDMYIAVEDRVSCLEEYFRIQG